MHYFSIVLQETYPDQLSRSVSESESLVGETSVRYNLTIQLYKNISHKKLSCSVCESQVHSPPSIRYLLTQLYCLCSVAAVKRLPVIAIYAVIILFWMYLCVRFSCHLFQARVDLTLRL